MTAKQVFDVHTRMCDRCKTPKPLNKGIQLAKMIGQRRAQTFVCWDCIAMHYRKHANAAANQP